MQKQLYIMWFSANASVFNMINFNKVAAMLSAQYSCIFLSTTQE